MAYTLETDVQSRSSQLETGWYTRERREDQTIPTSDGMIYIPEYSRQDQTTPTSGGMAYTQETGTMVLKSGRPNLRRDGVHTRDKTR